MRKIKFISILLVLSMLLTVPVFAFSTGFTDVSEKATYAEAVSYLADAGILRGTASGRFSPNEKITVSQWATMLCRAFDTEPEGTSWQETGTNAVQIAVRSGWLDPTAVWDKNGFICRGELYRTVFAAAGIPLYDATLYGLDWLSPSENTLRVGKELGLCAENKTAAELVTRAEAAQLLHAVLTQTLTQDAVLEQQARENSISTGKAALVNRVLTINPSLKFDVLAKLSVEELKDLAEAGAPAMPIGKDAAAYAAEQYAGTTALDSVTAEVDSELDESPAHYEVELQTAWGEFEYLVDAYTGKVLSGQKDLLAAVSASNETTKPSGQKPAPSGTVQDIGYAKAKSIALNHAGLSENQAYDMDIELDDEDGTLVYEVEFKSGNMEYDYEIDAASGTILKHEAELDD